MSRQRPFLCKLLVRFLKQELPALSFTTIALAIDATLKPHRDLANAKYSQAGILGLSEFEGGNLWIEDAEGKIKRRVTQDQVKTGVLLDISQQAQIFDSRRWHGADKHRGTRATLTGYTARQLYNLDRDLVEVLRNLGFQLPSTATAEIASSSSSSSSSSQQAALHNTTHSTDKHTSTITAPVTSFKTQDDDDEDDAWVFVFAGFVNSGTSGRCEDCGVVLEGSSRDPEPPWTALAAETEEANSGFNEAAQQRALDLLQRKCAEGLYEKKCPECLESHGHKRKCRRLTAEMVSKGTLSMDLSGPHPASFAGHRYFLAANLSVEDGDDIPFSRLLYTKKTEEVARALISVMCQIVSLAQGIPQIFRVHSDAGKEFTGGSFQETVSKCSIWPTMSAPYTPQQNGKAERLVGLLKSAAGALLLHAQLPLQLWSEAVLEATFLRRCRALKLLIPKDRPKMGDAVLVRKPPLSVEHPFEPRAEEGVFLANDERTPGGARIMVVRDGATSVRVVRMPVLKDKPVIRWKLEKGPREEVVWISTTGDIRWDAPPSDMITVEESMGETQPWNDGNAASDIIRERLRKHLVPETERQLFGLFGHGFMVVPEPDAVDPGPAAVATCQEEFQQESTEGFYRVYDIATEDSMNELETAVQLLADEEAVGEPVTTNIFFTGTPEEKKIWYDAAKTEVDNMVSSNAWVEVRSDHAHEDLNLDRSKKLPRVLPMTLVCTRKPLIMQDDQPVKQFDPGQAVHQLLEPPKDSQSASVVQAHEKMRYKPKVRLCVCGNFQESQPHMKDENAAETVPIEIVRLMLILLARNPLWNALSLDVSAAFLNALL